MTAPRSGQLLVGCLLGAVGSLVAPLGCAGLASGEPVGLLFGAVFGTSAALLLGSAAQALWEGGQGWREERAQREQVAHEDAPAPPGRPPLQVELLGAWSVGEEDWRKFNRHDLIFERAPVAFGIFLGFTVLGGPLLAFARALPWWFALPFSGGVGALVAGLWLLWITRARWQAAPRVRVTRDAVFVGHVRSTLRSDHHRLESVRLDPGEPGALVFTVSWSTRNGPASDEVRAPVPAAAWAEAERLVAEFTASIPP